MKFKNYKVKKAFSQYYLKKYQEGNTEDCFSLIQLDQQ